jgi:hypothetical protein
MLIIFNLQRLWMHNCQTEKPKMKLCLALLMALPLFITACKKDHEDNTIVWPTGVDSGCIERIFVHSNDHAIKAADIATVDNLFARNGFDPTNFRYISYLHGTYQATATPNVKHDEHIVWFDQYVKGVRYFRTEGGIVFWDDTVSRKLFKPVEVPALDTIPAMSLPRLRALFRYHLKTSYRFENSYGDSCFNAEFGFYKKYNYSATPGPDSTFKAWRVTVKNRPIAPAAYYNDGNEALIYFDDGTFFY